MSDPTINASAASAATYTAQSAAPVSTNKTLGQDDFLKLLVSQMQSQDPLNPQKDTDFIAQMAQFSSLEQTKTMSSQLGQISQGQQVTQASSLLGQYVVVTPVSGTPVAGLVNGVTIDKGTPQIMVNGKGYDLSQVSGISPYQPVKP